MDYYSISFHYAGPKASGPLANDHGREASKHLWDLIDDLQGALKEAGIEHINEYAWPDGSLYQYVRVRAGTDIKKVIHEAIDGKVDVKPIAFRSYPSDSQKSVGSEQTLEEAIDDKYKQ